MKELLKMWTLKDDIFTVCDAWENIPSSTLRLFRKKILDQGCDDHDQLEDADFRSLFWADQINSGFR